MFNDNLIRRPVNSTAAIVSSQSGCSDSLTAKQKKDSAVDRVNQLKAEIKSMPKSSKARKVKGIEIFNITQSIMELNLIIKRANIKEAERLDFFDCFFRVVQDQTTKLQYDRFMMLAHEMLATNKAEYDENI